MSVVHEILVGALPRTEAQPACPLCARPGAVLHRSIRDRAHGVAGDWSLRRCRACGIAWPDPQPIDEDSSLCYPQQYYTHQQVSQLGFDGQTSHRLKQKVRGLILAGRYGYDIAGVRTNGRRLGRLLGSIGPVRYRLAYRRDHSLPVWRAGGRLLDIGCGAGDYLRLAQSLGWETYGLDPDPAAARIARRGGAVVEVGTLDSASLPHARFDAVTAMHSIEHARDPRQFIRNALALLRPGGFFYLQTPNLGSLMHRRFGADWYALEMPRHLCLLTPAALRQLLEEACAWTSLTVRTNARRAVREQEQTIAMRRHGSFEATTVFSRRDRLGMAAWSWVEALGNRAMQWGEEVEVIGFRR